MPASFVKLDDLPESSSAIELRRKSSGLRRTPALVDDWVDFEYKASGRQAAG